MPTVVTNYFSKQMALQQINLSADTFKVSLMNEWVNITNGSVLREISAFSQVSAYEVSGNNYSAATLSGKDVVNSSFVYWDGGNIIWDNVTIEVYGCCIYRSTDGLVVGFMSFSNYDLPIIAVNGIFSINWNSNGIMQLVNPIS